MPTPEEIDQFVEEWWGPLKGWKPGGTDTVYTVFEYVDRKHFSDFVRDVLDKWVH